MHTCRFCKKKFYSILKTQRFCSDICKMSWREALAKIVLARKKICPVCLNPFVVKTPAQIYDSIKCKIIAYKSRGKRVRGFCISCGNKILK